MYRLRYSNPQNGTTFPSKKRTPQDLNNVLNREILPALKRCEQCRKNESEHDEADHDFKLDGMGW
jgi:hypothetical protein